MRLKKYGVMASASLWSASLAPANSSGVSVGMRCLSCQRQLFQSASETSRQKPRPAEWNSFKDRNRWPDGGSSPAADELSSFIFNVNYKLKLPPVKLTTLRCRRSSAVNNHGDLPSGLR